MVGASEDCVKSAQTLKCGKISYFHFVRRQFFGSVFVLRLFKKKKKKNPHELEGKLPLDSLTSVRTFYLSSSMAPKRRPKGLS